MALKCLLVTDVVITLVSYKLDCRKTILAVMQKNKTHKLRVVTLRLDPKAKEASVVKELKTEMEAAGLSYQAFDNSLKLVLKSCLSTKTW